ncbi:MAG: hypothetical protein RSC83_13380 [Hafnia sp.]
MYIPKPTKLLFQIDDGWGKLLTKYWDAIPEWTQLVVERMLACGTPAMGLRRYCCASSPTVEPIGDRFFEEWNVRSEQMASKWRIDGSELMTPMSPIES